MLDDAQHRCFILRERGKRHALEILLSVVPPGPVVQARSYKWVVGVIFILAALYAYLVNHISLFEAATIFGIGVILA
jgi:hypothetical protein